MNKKRQILVAGMGTPPAGRSERSTTRRSPSRMPAPTIESPSTRTKNVAAGRFTRSSFKSRISAEKALAFEGSRRPSGSRYCSAGDGNPAQHLAVTSGARFTHGASSCDLALQGSSLRSSGDPTPAARVHSPPKRSFFGAFPPISILLPLNSRRKLYHNTVLGIGVLFNSSLKLAAERVYVSEGHQNGLKNYFTW